MMCPEWGLSKIEGQAAWFTLKVISEVPVFKSSILQQVSVLGATGGKVWWREARRAVCTGFKKTA